jgi:flagellin-like hook-associated protein FlgL
MAMFGTVAANQNARTEQSNEMQQKMIDLVTSAMSYPPGSQARLAIGAEYDQAYAAWSQARVADNPITGSTTVAPGVWGIRGTTNDSIINTVAIHSLDHRSWFDYGHPTIDYLANGTPIGSIDVRNGSASNLSNGLATLKEHLFRAAPNHNGYGNHDKRLDWARKVTIQESDRLDTAISTLTDADMGKASTARANAETRQQLALSTISQAISAYGNYANGLLGNVSRTQRGVLA